MPDTLLPQNSSWNLLQKILFRFFFIYFILYTSPWDSLQIVPGISYLIDLFKQGFELLVIKSNEHFFQVFGIKHVKQVSNGSGDTSFAWAANYFLPQSCTRHSNS